MRGAIVLAVIALLGGAVRAAQEYTPLGSRNIGAAIHGGFVTGSQYRQMPENMRQVYAVGVVDGMLVAPVFGATAAEMRRLNSCIEGWKSDQVAALLSKYVEAHPEEWNKSAHVLMVEVLSTGCPR